MDSAVIREILGQPNAPYIQVEVVYRSEVGTQVTRTCFVDAGQQTLKLEGFDAIPEEWRVDFENTYKGLPCLELLCSLDRNGTGINQPKVQLLPEEIDDVRVLKWKTHAELGEEYSNSVELKTQDEHENTQIVLGYVLNLENIERMVADHRFESIQIASFIEDGQPQEIRTITPIFGQFALVYAHSKE